MEYGVGCGCCWRHTQLMVRIQSSVRFDGCTMLISKSHRIVVPLLLLEDRACNSRICYWSWITVFLSVWTDVVDGCVSVDQLFTVLSLLLYLQSMCMLFVWWGEVFLYRRRIVCIRFKSAIPRATVSPWNLNTVYTDLANKELYSGALRHVAMTFAWSGGEYGNVSLVHGSYPLLAMGGSFLCTCLVIDRWNCDNVNSSLVPTLVG